MNTQRLFMIHGRRERESEGQHDEHNGVNAMQSTSRKQIQQANHEWSRSQYVREMQNVKPTKPDHS
jgi:hypothetical protein